MKSIRFSWFDGNWRDVCDLRFELYISNCQKKNNFHGCGGGPVNISGVFDFATIPFLSPHHLSMQQIWCTKCTRAHPIRFFAYRFFLVLISVIICELNGLTVYIIGSVGKEWKKKLKHIEQRDSKRKRRGIKVVCERAETFCVLSELCSHRGWTRKKSCIYNR